MDIEYLIDEIDRLFGYDCEKRCSECNRCPVKEKFVAVKIELEKRIPIAPYRIGEIDNNDNADVICPACKSANNVSVKSIKQTYCWKCGQALKWG